MWLRRSGFEPDSSRIRDWLQLIARRAAEATIEHGWGEPGTKWSTDIDGRADPHEESLRVSRRIVSRRANELADATYGLILAAKAEFFGEEAAARP